jgi:hypothetical protein
LAFLGFGLENFQGFLGTQHVELAPITVIFGSNAAGKTSISRALRLLKQSHVETQQKGGVAFSFQGDGIDLVDFKSTIFAGDRHLPLGIELQLPVASYISERIESASIRLVQLVDFQIGTQLYDDEKEKPIFLPLDHSETSIVIKFDGLPNLSIESKHFNRKKFVEMVKSAREIADTPTKEKIAELDFATENLDEMATFDFHFEHPIWQEIAASLFQELDENAGSRYDLMELHKQLTSEFLGDMLVKLQGYGALHFDFGLPQLDENLAEEFCQFRLEPEWQDFFQMFFAQLGWLFTDIRGELESNLGNFEFIGPLRSVPRKVEIEKRLTKSILDNSEKVNEWLARFTDSRYQVETIRTGVGGAEELEVVTRLVHDRFTGVSVPFEMVGTGLSQILPVLESAFRTRGPLSLDKAISAASTIYVEQPELHLHPQMQAEVATMFVEAHSNSGNNFILETHSESILLRLQKHIRDGDLSPTDVSIIFVEASPYIEGEITQKRFNTMTSFSFMENGELSSQLPISFSEIRLRNEL